MSEDQLIRLPAPVPLKRKPGGLGRGLGALMGEVRREEPLVQVTGGAGTSSAASGFALIPPRKSNRIPISRAVISTRRRSTSWPLRSPAAG